MKDLSERIERLVTRKAMAGYVKISYNRLTRMLCGFENMPKEILDKINRKLDKIETRK